MEDVIRRTSTVLRRSVYLDTVRCFFIFYILVGLPNGFQVRFLPLFFRSHGMPLAQVGMYRLLVLPWLLKGVWAAYIGRHTDVRVWLKSSLFMLVVLCIAAAQFSPTETLPVVVVLFLLNLITSVQDTAVDTLILDIFSPSQLLMGNVAQAVGERIGSIISGGIFAWCIDILSWSAVFYIMAAMYGFGLLTSHLLLPDWRSSRSADQPPLQRAEDRDSDIDLRISFASDVSVVDTAKKFWSHASAWMFIFVMFYKIGEIGVLSLFPLFLVDQDVNTSDIGFWMGIVGQSVSILGSTAVAFYSFSSILGPLTLLMILRAICVAISWLAVMFWKTDPQRCYVGGVVSLLVVGLTGGAITTCTQTLLMQLSQLAPRYERSKHYAIYSFGELLAKLLFAASVGAIAQATSYEFAFGIFSLAAILIVPLVFFAPETVRIQMMD